MAKARQQYFADEVTLQKESREFAIEPELVEKLDSIETGAQVNVIETVKVNGEALVPDEDKAVDIDVPLVEDDLYGTDNDAALSARQGRVLYDYIQNIQSRGRYLSNWNCATGLAMTNPSDNPYDYRAGDYYIVSNVSSGTNYRPDGAQYIINQASTTVESEIVKVSDSYIYDGTTWVLLVNTEREIAVDSSLSTTSTNPVENRVVTNALNTKQDILIAGANIQIAADGKTISATDTTYSSLPAAEGGTDVSLVTTGEKYTWNGKQDKLIAGSNISIAADGKTISAVDTTYSNLPAAQGGTDVSLVSTGDKYIWNNKQDTLIAGTNIQIAADGKTVSATDTTYTAGTNVNIDSNNVISATDTTYTAGANISIDANNEISAVDTTYSSLPAASGGTDVSLVTTGEKYTWDNKQDELIAGTNIQIAADGKTISATDTTYVAGDFDIKDLADSTGLRTEWSGKQDALIAGTNIQIASDGKTISATDTTYTAGANISISNNNVISATDSKATWGNISGTLADQTDLNTALGGKQDTLIAGTNIQIASDGKTISATDTTYTAGTGISIDSNNVISNTQTSAAWGNITGTLSDQTDLNTALGGKQDTLIAGTNIQIDADGKTISATDTTYTAGTGIDITNGVISNTQTSAEWGNITGTLADQTDLVTALNAKQDDMVILSYGNSNWNDFITAYQKNGVVYCRASSNTDPSTGAQGRLAFMAYVNNADNPTEVEFQYYRSVATHSDSTQGDEVFVYKLNKTTGRSVTKRNAYTKIEAGTNMSSSYSNGTLTLSATDTTYNTATSSTAGIVKLGSDTLQTEAAQSASSTAGRTYPVQLNSSDQMVVNVPWEDTQTGSATSSAAGTVKLFSDTVQTETAQSVSSTANRTYGIQNNSSNQMVVNVPWTDTTYSNGTYLTLNGTTFDVDTSLIATKSDLANFAGFQVVATLPTSDIKTNIIYLLGPFTSVTGGDKYEEWIYSNNNWIMIGETSVDLSPYFNYTTQTSDAITEGSTNLFLTSAERTILGNTSNTNTGDETKTTIQTKLGAASASNSGYLTSTDWSTFNGKANAADANTKTFFWVGTPSTAEGLEVWNWVSSGKNAVIAYRTQAGELVTEYMMTQCAQRSGSFSGFATFESVGTPGTTLDYGGTYSKSSRGYINIAENGTVTMTTLSGNINYLATDVDYSTVYTPAYDGSPATKKYVDDNVKSNVRLFNLPSQNDDISDIITRLNNGGGVVFYKTYSELATVVGTRYYVVTDYNKQQGIIKAEGDIANATITLTSGTTTVASVTTGGENVKKFSLSSTSDTTTAEKVVDWYNGGNIPVIVYDSVLYVFHSYQYNSHNGKSYYTFLANTVSTNNTSTSSLTNRGLVISYNPNAAFPFSINISDQNLGEYLRTGVDYATPYTPEYNGSPATKKYVDDNASNTKTFYLSSTSDLTNAQAAYDWYKAGKNPIISLMPLGVNYTVQALSTNYLAFVSGTNSNGISAGGSYSYINDYTLLLNKSGDTITSVSLSSNMGWNSDVHYLDINVDYADPYIPQYNGSPATKKYVDDSIPTYTAGSNVTIEEVCESDMRGPAPSGYHVPSISEMESLWGILTTTFSLQRKAVTIGTYLKMPMAGFRVYGDASINSVSSSGMYWTASPEGSNDAYILNFSSSSIYSQTYQYRSYGFSIRCFKNTPVIPDSSWTTLYDGSSVATDAGVFYNSTLGLISVSGDGTTWYTIQDKNLGATTVYNYGDTLTDANCGGYFQWGNNYMFPAANSSETISTSSTQVDVTGYGPGNYYSSSTWITTYTWQDATSDGTNLRGGISQSTQCSNMISATDTTYESKTAASGGTDVSLVTTGEKYTWNNKANASDITVKAYTTNGTMDIQTFMAIVNGLAINGIAPIIIYNTEPYYYERAVNNTSTLTLYFYAPSNGVSSGTLYNKRLTASLSMSTYEVTITQSNENLALGSGDMSYSDFSWQSKSGATITLDLASTYTPSANFTVNAPSTIKDGQTYILRVNNGATAYTMTLGTNVTNPFDTDITLTANGVDQFVFLAIGGALELQPEGGGGGIAPATNSPINVKYIWAGTQAQYEALSSYDDNTVYLTV